MNDILTQIEILEKGKFVEKMVAAKVLKRMSETEPETLIPYYANFLKIVSDKNVKVAWATLFLLTPMATFKPEMAFENLGLFAQLADGDSVIARDQYVKILTTLSTHDAYYDTCITLLIDEVLKAPVNQLPSYATFTTSVIKKKEDATLLRDLIASRIPETDDYPPKQKKLQQLKKQLHKSWLS